MALVSHWSPERVTRTYRKGPRYTCLTVADIEGNVSATGEMRRC